jgi:hypothetical protein
VASSVPAVFTVDFRSSSPSIFALVRTTVAIEPAILTLSSGSNPPARQQDIAKLSIILAQQTFEDWASRSKVDLFAESSDLLLRVVFTTCFGEQYAQSHEIELFAIMKGLQDGLTNPWFRLLPVWATACGRRLLRSKASLQRMLEAEVQDRLRDLDSCREARDYLSFFLLSQSSKGTIESENDLSTHFVSQLQFFLWLRSDETLYYTSVGVVFRHRSREHGWHIQLDSTTPSP